MVFREERFQIYLEAEWQGGSQSHYSTFYSRAGGV